MKRRSGVQKRRLRISQTEINRIAPLVTKLINEAHGTNLKVEDVMYTLTPDTLQGLMPSEAILTDLRKQGLRGSAKYTLSFL